MAPEIRKKVARRKKAANKSVKKETEAQKVKPKKKKRS
jgi:hypothetical protein